MKVRVMKVRVRQGIAILSYDTQPEVEEIFEIIFKLFIEPQNMKRSIELYIQKNGIFIIIFLFTWIILICQNYKFKIFTWFA